MLSPYNALRIVIVPLILTLQQKAHIAWIVHQSIV
jgi:hypothetical protein